MIWYAFQQRGIEGFRQMAGERFKDAGVNIQSLHIVDRREGFAIVAISADDRAKAETLVDSASAV